MFLLNLTSAFARSATSRNETPWEIVKKFRRRGKVVPQAQGPLDDHVTVLTYGPLIRAVPGTAIKFDPPKTLPRINRGFRVVDRRLAAAQIGGRP
jgi:hypothetical protein